ncbi:MAG: hypothetical protein ACFE0Q_05895 [Anaerolineae bacterium]
MRLASTIFSAILALLAVPFFTIAACNFAIEAAVFNRSTYNAVLDDEVLFEGMITSALPVVLTASEADVNFEGQVNASVRIQDVALALEDKPDTWATVTDLLIPADWLQTTSTQLVDVIFGIMARDLSVLDAEVDFTDIRTRFNGEQAQQASRAIITEAPACTNEQQVQMRAIIEGQPGTLPICNPINDSALTNDAIGFLEQWLADTAQVLANDRIPISQAFDLNRDDARIFGIVVELIFDQALLLLYLCPTALLSILILLAVRSLKGFSRWIGSVLIAVGVLILLVILALQAVTFSVISESFVNSSTPAETFIARFVSAMVRSAVSESSFSLLVQSATFIGLGFVIFALAWYLGRNRDEEGQFVLITDDGQVISTATQRKIGDLDS